MAFLMQMMTLCNKTVFEDAGKKSGPRKKNQIRKIIGNHTEGALLKAADEYIDTDGLRRKAPLVKEIAFNLRKNFHLTVHHIIDPQLIMNSADVIHLLESKPNYDYIIFVKGALEYVLGMCTYAVIGTTENAMDTVLTGRI